MNKQIRKKVSKAKLENLLSKYARRITKLAERAYKVRQILESLTVVAPEA